MSKQLKGLTVEIMYAQAVNNAANSFPNPPASYRRIIKQLGAQMGSETRIDTLTWPLITNVAQWYQPTSPYRSDDSFPNPALHASNLRSVAVNVGKDAEQNPWATEWYPASQLKIIGLQSFGGRLINDQTANMITHALRRPEEHRADLLGTLGMSGTFGGLDQFDFTNTNLQGGLAHANMSAGVDLLTVPSRRIAAPQISYRNAKDPGNRSDLRTKTVNMAEWDLRNIGFAQARQTTVLPVINLSGGTFTIDATRFVEILRSHGVVPNLRLRPYIIMPGAGSDPMSQAALSMAWETQMHQLIHRALSGLDRNARVAILVVLDRHDYDHYASIKRVADLRNGTPTICVTRQNLMKNNAQLTSNLALKYNIKLGGITHFLEPQIRTRHYRSRRRRDTS